MKNCFFLLCVKLIFIQCLFSQSWEKKTNFPHNKLYKAVAFSINDFGYAGLGSSPGRLERDFWRYNPLEEKWSQIDSFPAPGRAGAFSFVINEKAYVGGGETFEGNTRKDFWEYNPKTNIWTKKTDIPFDFVDDSNMEGFSIGNYGYLKASYNKNGFFQYDPTTDIWTKKANYPPGYRFIDQVSFSVNGKGYIGSGFAQTENTNEFWEYDPIFDEWSRIADFPGTPRNGAVAFSIGDYGYVGLGNASGHYPRDFWRYDSKNNTWSQIDSCGYAAQGAFAFTIGKFGFVGTGIYTNEGEFWSYNPIIDSNDDINKNIRISVYPNPAKKEITISNPYGTIIREIEIIDLSGRTIHKWNEIGYGENVLQIESILPGIYILKFKTEFGIKTQKLILL